MQLQRFKDGIYSACALPTSKGVIDRIPWAETFWKISPRSTGVEDPENAIEHLAWFASRGDSLIGDPQLFYFLPAYAAGNYQSLFAFGYIKSVRPGDRYHALLMHYSSTSADDTGRRWNSGAGQSATSYGTQGLAFDDSSLRVLARPYSQLFGTAAWWLKGMFARFGTGMNAPDAPDNAFYMSTDPIMLMEAGNHLRGYLPGIICPFGTLTPWYRKNFSNLPALPNKIVRFVGATWTESTANGGPTMAGFDLTGPWR